LLQDADASYRQCLRKAADVMERDGIDAAAVVRKSPDEITRLLAGLKVKDPEALARRMHAAIYHLACKFPDAGLPATPTPARDIQELPRRRTLRRRFRSELVGAYLAVSRLRLSDPDAAGKPITLWTQLRCCREMLSAAVRGGTVVSDEFGFEALSYEPIARVALDRLRAYYSPKTASKILGGFIKLAGLVLGLDHPHVAWLRDQRTPRNRALQHGPETKLAKIMSSDGVQRLLEAPDQIAACSTEAGCARKDEIGRLQHAVCLGLKLRHPALRPAQAVKLDFNEDIKLVEGKRCLVLWPASKGRQAVAEPMAREDLGRIKQLQAARRRTGLSSSLLYPTRDEAFADAPVHDAGRSTRPRHRKGGAPLQGLYLEIKLSTGLKVDFQDIKDLIARVWLESGIEPFVVARRAGYVHVRSLETRMSAHFKSKGCA
jgi:hypothetical protein